MFAARVFKVISNVKYCLKNEKREKEKSQMTLSTSSSGDPIGVRPIHKVAFPLHKLMESLWNRWVTASAGGLPDL